MENYELAKTVFNKEIEVLKNVKHQLNETFNKMLEAIQQCNGKVVIIGMGKSGHVAKKMAASMASLGTCAISLHPGECMHGDLGMIQKADVVILISYSGESEEILHIIPSIKIIGAKILGITCNRNSTLSQYCDVIQFFDNVEEACHLGLAPTSSTTAIMVYGDALAVVASKNKGFSKNDFGIFHPAGSLGKKITIRSLDLMHVIPNDCLINPEAKLCSALIAMSKNETNILTVVDENSYLIGIITNIDIEHLLLSNVDIYNQTIGSIIHYYPHFIDISAMAIEALKIMVNNNIYSLPIVKNDIPVGIIYKNDIIKAGIYL